MICSIISGFQSNDLKMLPAFRPDKVYNFESGEELKRYLEALGEVCNSEIKNFADLMFLPGKSH